MSRISESFLGIKVLFSFSSPDISLLHLFHFDFYKKQNYKLFLAKTASLSRFWQEKTSICTRRSALSDCQVHHVT